ncbi:alkaline phosphatase family protein [Streptomyces sp. CA-106131]|uniref:alkaline phosphatase family protein n=2 Tax=unclassified Streptomyces TaxID=2593676 RepID=UPI003D8DE66F
MRRPVKRTRLMMAAGSIAALVGLTTQIASAAPTPAAAPAAQTSASPIKHVVEIMLENHSFDNLFGNFPGADGIPSGTSLQNPNATYHSAPDVSPVWASPNEGDVYSGIANGRAAEQMMMDYEPHKGYLMDHYTMFPGEGMASITEFGPEFTPNQQYLASHYALEDHNFQPVIAPTQPNVMYALNADGHDWMYNDLNPNDTKPWNSIFDELAAHNRTGKVYYGVPRTHLTGTIWEKIVPPDLTDLSTTDQFISDASSGNLPDFSFVRPGVDYSGEPEEDLGNPDAWIGQLVDTVAKSPDWNSTAIFVTYDEGGGFWDHVAPPMNNQYGYGSRTPTMIVSPYVREGVFHPETTNMSILSFMQKQWDMPPLNNLNAKQNDLSDAFDFDQAPLPAPQMPVAPADTLAFRGGTDTSHAPIPKLNSKATFYLEANGSGLSLDSAANGPVTLTITPPRGVAVPANFPSTVNLTDGWASFVTTFTQAGYYRIKAEGPNGSVGWQTVDVGVNANTLPTP